MTRARGTLIDQTIIENLSKLPEQMENIATSIRHSNSEMIDLFQRINNDVIITIQSQSELTRQCIVKCFEDHSTNEEDKKELIDVLIKTTNKTIENSSKEMIECMKETFLNQNKHFNMSNSKDSEKTNNSTEINEKIKDEWQKLLGKRKIRYFKHLRNKKLASTYEKELEKPTPLMPRKFQPTKLDNEPESEFNIRQQRALNDFKLEIELLKTREKRFEKEYKTLDENMITIIENNYTGDSCNQLKELWDKECRKEESKSNEIYARKEEFIKENLTDEPRKRRDPAPPKDGRNEKDKVRATEKSNFRRGRIQKKRH